MAVFVLGDALGTLLWNSALASPRWVVGRPALQLVDAGDRWSLVAGRWPRSWCCSSGPCS